MKTLVVKIEYQTEDDLIEAVNEMSYAVEDHPGDRSYIDFECLDDDDDGNEIVRYRRTVINN